MSAQAALVTYAQEVLPANVLTNDVAMANNAAIPALNSRSSQSLPSVGTRSESSTARFWPALAGSVGGFALLMMPSPPWACHFRQRYARARNDQSGIGR